MPQQTDIVLAGDGYMLVPGTYRRTTGGVPEAAPGTNLLRDFIGGQRRAIQFEAERGWDSEGVGPALLGQGVEPWPYVADYTDSTIGFPSGSEPLPAMRLGDHIYIGIGQFLYRSVAITATTWTDFTEVADLGAGTTITALAIYGDDLAVLCGGTLDIQIFDPGTSALTTMQTGERGSHGVGYAAKLVYSVPGTGEIRLTTGGGIDSRTLDSPVERMALHGGKIAIATRGSLYQLGGRPDATEGEWTGEPEPFFTHGAWTGPDDFAFLASFGGRLFTWIGNSVMEWNPNGGANRQGWRSIGIEGRSCYGATVAGSWLIVAIRANDGSGQLWAYDGSGAWLIEAGALRIWPLALSGAGGFDLLAFRDASTTCDRYRLVHRDPAAPAYRSAGAYRTSLLHAGHPDEVKIWRTITASFSSPEERGNAASTDVVDLTIRYSVDGGDTWTVAATASVGGTVSRVYDLGGVLPGALPKSRYLQVEVAGSSVTDWAPTLTVISVGYERVPEADRRRRWQFTVAARDRQIERDGQLHLSTAPEIVADLWAAWEAGAELPFRDLDYDTEPIERRVRVVALTETVPTPANAPQPPTSQVQVTLVEA